MSKFFKALKQAEEDRVRQDDEVFISPAPPTREPLLLRNSNRSESAAEERTPVARSDVAPAAPPPIPAHVPPAPQPAAPLRSQDSNETGIVEEHLVTLLAPTSFESEQYRTLRTLLEARRQDGGPAVIAVSSPSVGDGKTTTAINLAAVLAEGEESRVLLIDADLRNPSVAGKLGLSRSIAGLTHALRARGTSLDDLVLRRPPFNIDVLLAGQSSKAPYELLKSSVFADLLKEARRRYEFVVIDTPPIVSLPDCRLIGNLVDGFLIVVAAHRTPKKLVEEALNAVDPEKVLGLIFNGDEQGLSGYRYRYPYGETYGPSKRRKGGNGENA